MKVRKVRIYRFCGLEVLQAREVLAYAPPMIDHSHTTAIPPDNKNSVLLHIETGVMKNETNARAHTRVRHQRPRHGKESVRIPLRAAHARRSVENILQWNCYLPPACVKTMVRMGWDYTT